MNEGNVVNTYNGITVILKKEGNPTTSDNMGESGRRYAT